MKAEDYLQLPDITYHEILVELDAKFRKVYDELERMMVPQLRRTRGRHQCYQCCSTQ